MTETKHKHEHRMHTHVDGCHFFTTSYICSCGDVQIRGHERDFRNEDDPYSVMFALDDCPRCRELLNGAEPKALT